MDPLAVAELQRLVSLFPIWESWVMEDPERSTLRPGGALESDGPLPGGWLPAHLAWRGLAASCEHLGLLGDYLTLSADRVCPRPYAVLTRAVMLGAARCIYLMHPNDSRTRRVRALELLAAEIDGMVGVFGDLKRWRASGPDDHDAVESIIGDLSQVRGDLQRELASLGLKPGRRLSETDLLGRVAENLDHRHIHVPSAMAESWRYSSAVAHAYAWHWELVKPADDPSEEMVNTVMLPAWLIEQAWAMWDQRREE